MTESLQYSDVEKARVHIRDVVRLIPMRHSETVSRMAGFAVRCRLLYRLETRNAAYLQDLVRILKDKGLQIKIV